MARCVLAIDQGTTNSKALLLSESGEVVASAARPVPIRYPRPGWVEQDAEELWRSAVEAASECLALAGSPKPDAIGICNQRESAVAWDRRTGAPLGPCITWQCRRSAPFCAELRDKGLEEMVARRTGLAIDPVCTAGKWRWLLEHAPQAEVALGTVDSWLLWKLTGGGAHATDLTNASRTQLLNLDRLDWDCELLDLFGIPRAGMPALKESSWVYGETGADCGLPPGIPIAALAGDSHAALFGHAIFTPGAVKATYGTGSSLMTLTGAPVRSRQLSTTIGWAAGGSAKYALEGNIFCTGGAVQWVGEFLGLKDAAEAARLACTAADNGGVYLVPAFTGLGAPYWEDAARGIFCGLTGGSTAAHAARAAIEAIAFQVADVVDAMEIAGGAAIPALLADGGGTRNDFLMQFQADILDRVVLRSAVADVSAIGAGWFAGLATGVWPDLESLAALAPREQLFEPAMASSERERLRDGWRDAVRRSLVKR